MKNKLKLSLIVLSAAIASLGTYPYAKEFSSTLFHNNILSFLLASICVPAALSANIALGTYSLNNSISQTMRCNWSRTLLVVVICVFSAASTGFMCFVGYSAKLPLAVNLLVSAIVVIVNTGIGFSAINNAINDLSKSTLTPKHTLLKKIRREPIKVSLSIVTMLSALIVTLTAYLASTNGLSRIFSHYHFSGNAVDNFVYLLAVIIWVPTAVLFANGSRVTVEKMYDMVKKKRFEFSYLTILVALVAFSSGSAYAQMSLEFFDAYKCIPDIFKNISRHYDFVFYVIMPLAFFISAVVNGYALNNVIKQVRR